MYIKVFWYLRQKIKKQTNFTADKQLIIFIIILEPHTKVAEFTIQLYKTIFINSYDIINLCSFQKSKNRKIIYSFLSVFSIKGTQRLIINISIDMQASNTQVSAHQSDYTCPDFLEKLLGKSALTAQTNCSIRNIEETFQSKPQVNWKVVTRTPKKAETVKVLGERGQKTKSNELNNFCVFFKEILKQFKSVPEIEQLWTGFEEVMHSEQQVNSYIGNLKNSNVQENIRKSEEGQNSLTQSSSKLSQDNEIKINTRTHISKTLNKNIACSTPLRKYSRSVIKRKNFPKLELKKALQLQSTIITSSLFNGEQKIKKN